MASSTGRPTTLGRTRSNFLTRTAEDVSSQLERRWSVFPGTPSPGREQSAPLLHKERPSRLRAIRDLLSARAAVPSLSDSRDFARGSEPPVTTSSAQRGRDEQPRYKPTSGPRPVLASSKLGTFAGVFVPTTLNVLSILMFLRFGFILGQAGLLGFMGMLVTCYLINVITTMSLSAIATNGTVRGGGAYYLISRSLGPEFGGSIGIVFYLGFIFNTGMNAVGLIDCISNNFGAIRGNWANWLPESYWWNYLWATVVLVLCTAICLAGSGLFARASNGLLLVLLVATFSIPFSALVLQPFEDRKLGVYYTGPSLDTLKGNLYPGLTRGADGSQLHGRETWQDLFGILFPATGGIFAGASMSGDLKHPSKAIPKGTLYGLGLTFITYTLVILTMALTTTRATFYRNVNVVQDVNLSGVVILMGEFSTSFFSTLMGVIGSAKLLQALARDSLFPGLSIFSQGTKSKDEPTYAILITYVLAQLTMLSDINQIASFVTMTYLMTFLVMNLACFLLKISSAPNFRPSFRYFNWATAFAGASLSGATMFFVDGAYASGCMLLLAILFLVAHYTTAPKSWGDVSQSLIYHQVRKYLLRLRQEHVKFWRPQILLFINDPRRQYRLIQFCNSLKKGSLYILGHVIVTEDFGGAVPEAKRQQQAWTKYIDFSKIKAFVNIAISPSIEWGSRNIVLNAGLGGMRPNIVVMGFFNLDDRREAEQLIDIRSTASTEALPSLTKGKLEEDTMTQSCHSQATASSIPAVPRGTRRRGKSQTNRPPVLLPTDANRPEHPVAAASYVTVVEDLLLRLQANVALAKGFDKIDLPGPKSSPLERLRQWFTTNDAALDENKQYIDLWPIQMSAEISTSTPLNREGKNMLTTNFDTYTLILQLGCILTTVPSWKRTHRLRVAVFVEYEADVEEERGRVKTLLSNLRIQADVLVFWLACGDLHTYEVIVNGRSGPQYADATKEVSSQLKDEEWWAEMTTLREKVAVSSQASGMRDMAEVAGLLEAANNWPEASFQDGRKGVPAKRFRGLKKILRGTRRRTSMSGLSQLGVSLGMRTSRLDPSFVEDSSDGDASDGTTTGESAVTFTPRMSAEGSRVSSLRGSPAVSDTDDGPGELAASENDLSLSDNEVPFTSPRRAVSSEALRVRKSSPPDIRRESWRRKAAVEASQQQGSPPKLVRSIETQPNASPAPGLTVEDANSQATGRPSMLRQQSAPKFTSKPVPRTTIAQNEDEGPSIMFAHQPLSEGLRDTSVYARIQRSPQKVDTPDTATPETSASRLTAPAVPLSFNDLPCRAQHIILNELMRAVSSSTPQTHDGLAQGASSDVRHRAMITAATESTAYSGTTDGRGEQPGTAVAFTTLPSPVPGTGESERDSLRYLMDLEVLCKGLPPCMLIHSNSISVTMSL